MGHAVIRKSIIVLPKCLRLIKAPSNITYGSYFNISPIRYNAGDMSTHDTVQSNRRMLKSTDNTAKQKLY